MANNNAGGDKRINGSWYEFRVTAVHDMEETVLWANVLCAVELNPTVEKLTNYKTASKFNCRENEKF